MENMAASLTSTYPIPASATAVAATARNRRRRISAEAGHALEILGHAIEYLSDELIHEGVPVTAENGQVQAVQLLMALNRSIYFDCPVAPSFGERLHGFFQRQAA